MQKVFGFFAVPCGTEAGEPLQARKKTKERGHMLNKEILELGHEEVPDRSAK